MRSWNLGNIAGIRIGIHWTFILLPIWIFISSIANGSDVFAAVYVVALVLAIFACVLLHELGHALAARQFGIPTQSIVLLPIGGVARLERMPSKPAQELWIAAAGPLVNIVIAAALFPSLYFASATDGFLWQLALANVVLVVFNMIPAFPLDGGRIFRSLLALVMDRSKATRIAASAGKFIAIAFGLLALVGGDPMLLIIAVFVYFAAQSELAATLAGDDLWGRIKSDEMVGAGQTSMETATLKDNDFVISSLPTRSAAAWLVKRQLEMCRVVEAGRIIGTINRDQLLSALARGLGNEPVGQLVHD